MGYATLVHFPYIDVQCWHGMQGTVTLPSSAPGTRYDMAINGGTMVMWASQRRLSLGAIFLQAAIAAASKPMASGSTAVAQHKVCQHTGALLCTLCLCHMPCLRSDSKARAFGSQDKGL